MPVGGSRSPSHRGRSPSTRGRSSQPRSYSRSRSRSASYSDYSDSFYSDYSDGRRSKKKASPARNTKSNASTGLADKSFYRNNTQTKKKTMGKKGPAGRNPKGGGGAVSPRNMDYVTKRMLSARRIKINELKNETEDLANQLAILQNENRTLRREQHLREKALDKYEYQENDMSNVLQKHNSEVRVLKETVRKNKEKNQRLDHALKSTNEELERTKKLLKKMKGLVEDKELAERDELARKLSKAESLLDEKDKRVRELERHTENLQKNHKHEMGIERARHKDTNKQLRELQEKYDQIQIQLREKEKEIEVKNIYANRMLKPPHHLNSSTSSSPAPMRAIRERKNSEPSGMTPREKAKLMEQQRREDMRKKKESIRLPTVKEHKLRRHGFTRSHHITSTPSRRSPTDMSIESITERANSIFLTENDHNGGDNIDTQVEQVPDSSRGGGGSNGKLLSSDVHINKSQALPPILAVRISTDKKHDSYQRFDSSPYKATGLSRRDLLSVDSHSKGDWEPISYSSSHGDGHTLERDRREAEIRERRDREDREERDRQAEIERERRERESEEERQKREDREWRERKERERREREDRERREKEDEERRKRREEEEEERRWKEERERRKKEADDMFSTQKREKEDRERREREEKERKDREEREREEVERRAAEERDRLERDDEEQERRRQRELLLSKMKAIDDGTGKAKKDSDLYSLSKGKTVTKEREDSIFGSSHHNKKDYEFTKPIENLHSGKPAYEPSGLMDKKKKQFSLFDSDGDSDGGYNPSFGTSRRGDKKTTNKNTFFDDSPVGSASKSRTTHSKSKKGDLMTDLFGSSATKKTNANTETTKDLEFTFNSSPKKTNAATGKKDVSTTQIYGGGSAFLESDDFGSGGKNGLLPRRMKQPATTIHNRPTVNAVDDFEDEIEEVIL